MPLQATSGAASYDAFGGGVAVVPAYIEDVFSTFLYTGNGSTGQAINNGIDLSTKGGLVWARLRTIANDHHFFDTTRGQKSILWSNLTDANYVSSVNQVSYNTNGFSFLTSGDNAVNANGYAGVSWTFREQPKFFDVVTYTGDGTAGRTIAHSLGSVPGCIIVKQTNASARWVVYHRSLGATKYLQLDKTAVAQTYNGFWNDTSPTSTVFTVGNDSEINGSGSTYVAYIFAHDAGGFGLTGTDNVISCGSYTGNGTAGNAVTLGYEPQWVMIKRTDTAGDNWLMQDIMRGIPNSGSSFYLYANTSAAESDGGAPTVIPTATGFTLPSYGGWNASGGTFIYIAIRRGPMKVPTTGTSVFGISARTGTGANATVTGSAGVSDAVLVKNRGSAVASLFSSRLTGTGYLVTSATAAEVAAGTTILQANPWDVMDGVKVGTTSTITNASANTFINYLFDRAPSFFDVVCYTGTGSATTFSHNLQAVPELMIVKRRSTLRSWAVYNFFNTATDFMSLELTTASAADSSLWNNTAPTSSVFTVNNAQSVNASGSTYVAYLFATCAGVSKVFSYTGNGSSQTINCGFTGGARFVLIKRTDSTGDWYVWDTARGIVSGNDPHLSLNTTAAEVTTDDTIDTDSTGFVVNQVAATNVNVSSATYIGLAVA
jgi:hypothetical protein